MTTTPSATDVFNRIDATRDAVTVRRVFGDAYQYNGTTVIPVAAVRGIGGGGAGTQTDTDQPAGSGGGMGYAVSRHTTRTARSARLP